MAVVESVEVRARTVPHTHLANGVGIHLLRLGKPGGVIILTAVQRLLQRAHYLGVGLTVRLAQLLVGVEELHHMSRAIVFDAGVRLAGNNDADAIVAPFIVEARCVCVVVGKANSHNLTICSLECGILAAAAVATCTNSFGKFSEEVFLPLKCNIPCFLCKLLKILYYLCTVSI